MAYTQETHNSWVRSEAMLAAANCEVDLGFYREAINNYRSSIELATMSGKLSNQFLPGLNIGLAYTRLGEYEQAITQISETLERMKSVHVPRTFAWGQLAMPLREMEISRQRWSGTPHRQAPVASNRPYHSFTIAWLPN